MARRNVFLTYHHADQGEVNDLIKSTYFAFSDMRAVGVSEGDDFVESDNTDYVLRRIREKYLRGTSATVALIGKCSWARKYVDWEIAATLRNNRNDPRGALLAVQLPSIDGRSDVCLPDRLAINQGYDIKSGTELGYASYHRYPSSGSLLAQWVEDAISRSRYRNPVAGSTMNLRRRNSSC